MRNVIVRGAATALALTVMLFASMTTMAAAPNVFYGLLIHVSTTNIKVENPKTKQTLGFELIPHFDQIFSSDGKTTYQMKQLKEGHYVGVIYQQKELGARFATKIYVMSNANERLKVVK